jgi:glycerophosphoryl diester phosphodiesterase
VRVYAAWGAAGADGVVVPTRRTPRGGLVASAEPGGAGPALEEVLDAARGRAILDVRNVPGEPDFDAPTEETVRLLVALLAARAGRDGARTDDVVVSSADWFAAEKARDAGLRAAFVALPGIALSAALAYVSDAGLAECHPHWTAVLEAPEVMAAAQGRAVVCWGVDDPGVARRLRDAGVAGVITNDPASIVAELGLG